MPEIRTAEFAEMRNSFEKWIKSDQCKIYTSRNISWAKRNEVPSHIWYNDGHINSLFLAFMNGYSLKECLSRIG